MVYVFLAEGFEEVEALTPVDCLRRAGVEVKTAGVGGKVINGAHGIPVQCDITAGEIVLDSALQMIVLPGGMPGTKNLEADADVQRAIAYCAENGIYIGAICAAPSILGHLGLLNGKTAVCYPGFEPALTGAKIGNAPAVKDGKFITAKGPGAALHFGLSLVAALTDHAAAQKLAAGMIFTGGAGDIA